MTRTMAQMVDAALRRAPKMVRGPIVFTDKDGNTATSVAVGRPPEGAASDSFKDATLIRAKHRSLSVLPKGLAFKPVVGMYATWEGQQWNVLGAVPILPSGAETEDADDPAILIYRVTLSR